MGETSLSFTINVQFYLYYFDFTHLFDLGLFLNLWSYELAVFVFEFNITANRF